MNPMTPAQALDVLNQATDPRTVGKMSRGDYVACDQAIAVLTEFVKAHDVQDTLKPVKPDGQSQQTRP